MKCPDPLLTCPTFYCPRNCLHDQFASKCNFGNGTCTYVEHSTNQTQDIFEVLDIAEHGNVMEHYVTNSDTLKDDTKTVLDHAARMFIKMSVGEVISFVAYSLLVVVSCTILMIYVVKFLRQRGDFRSMIPRWFPTWFTRSNAWRVDSLQWAFSHRQLGGGDGGENPDKDKMVASVLNNLRVDNTTMGIVHNLDVQDDILDEGIHGESRIEIAEAGNQNDETNVEEISQQRTILRSQLPPLPGVGRILSVPGFTYIDDSMLISNEDDLLTAVEATAVGSRTSCRSSQLESCSVQSVLDENEVLDNCTVRRRK